MTENNIDAEELQRKVDEAVGELGLRDEVVVGEPITVAEFAQMVKGMKAARDGDE
jgi:hypothetical protein